MNADEFILTVTGGEADPKLWRTARVRKLLKKLGTSWDPENDPDYYATRLAIYETCRLVAELERAVRNAQRERQAVKSMDDLTKAAANYHRAVAEHFASCQN